jgi:hypothetical protein
MRLFVFPIYGIYEKLKLTQTKYIVNTAYFSINYYAKMNNTTIEHNTIGAIIIACNL